MAMDEAAGNGHLSVVNWPHANRNEGCIITDMQLKWPPVCSRIIKNEF